MIEEWKVKGELLQELNALRDRIAQLERGERVETDREFVEPEQAFKTIFADVAEGILLADVESEKFISGNKAICRMLGYCPQETAKLGVMDIYPQEDTDDIRRQFDKQARGELTFARNIPVRRKDGSIFYADINSVPVTSAGRTYLMSVFREASRRAIQSTPQQNAGADSDAGKPLTASEMRVLRLIVHGMSNREIAQSIHRSVRTVEGHRARLMHKLGTDNSVELVKQAATMGLVELPPGKNQTTPLEAERTALE